MSRHTIAVAAVLVLALAACAGEADGPAAEPDPTSGEAEAPDDGPDEGPDDTDDGPDDGDPSLEPDDRIEPDEPGDPGGATASLDDEVQLAIDDAAERSGTDRSEVEVVSTELVTWPDGSLGCPDPDQMYTMALVDGYRIVLEVEGNELDYHGAEGSPPGYCADPQPPAEGGAPTS